MDDPEGEAGWIANVYASILRVRRNCSAFHPDALQEVVPTEGALFAVLRESLDQGRKVLCIFNFSPDEFAVDESWVTSLLGQPASRNLLGRRKVLDAADWSLGGYECVWFE